MNLHPKSCVFTGVFLTVLLVQVLSGCVERGSVGSMDGNVVALSWNEPTTNIDGSSLEDLAGYRVYYGTALGKYPQMVEVNDPEVTRRVFANLAPATYYFVVTAYDADGNESDYSNVAIKTVQ